MVTMSLLSIVGAGLASSSGPSVPSIQGHDLAASTWLFARRATVNDAADQLVTLLLLRVFLGHAVDLACIASWSRLGFDMISGAAFLWSECTRKILDTASVKKMIQIMGPAPLPPCRCVRRGSFATSGVGFLVTLTDTRMNGKEVLRDWSIGTRVRPQLIHVLVDRANKRANVSEWVRRAGTQPFETMARELYSLHETDLVSKCDSDSALADS